jgi:PAS domain S-box-containing protein
MPESSVASDAAENTTDSGTATHDLARHGLLGDRPDVLESVVANAHDAVIITEADVLDPPGPRIVYVNEAFTRMSGYAPEEVLGRSPRFLQGPDSDPDALLRIRAALEMREPVRQELVNYTKDGERYWVELNIVPVTDGEGRGHFVSVQRDVTQQKQAEAALAEANAALQQRLDLEDLATRTATRFVTVSTDSIEGEIADALARIGRFGELDRVYLYTYHGEGPSRRATLAYEWASPEVGPVTETWRSFGADDTPACLVGFAEADRHHMRNAAHLEAWRMASLPAASSMRRVPDADVLGEASEERRFMRANAIAAHLTLPLLHEGDVIGCLGLNGAPEALTRFLTTRPARQSLGIDAEPGSGKSDPWATDEVPLLRLIAEVFANALARKAAQEQIQASLREKETLLKEIHHRVKNNLQVISSLLGLQARKITDRRVLRSLRDARERVRSMALVHEQLYLSDSLSHIDFCAYVDQLATKLAHAHNPAVDVAVDVANVDLAVDRAIPCGLIINELLSNALEHAFPCGDEGDEAPPPDARVDIGFHRAEGVYRLEVRDNGVGLPPGADVQALKAGSLGLELVTALVGQLDGHLDVTSDPSEGGAAFVITFED